MNFIPLAVLITLITAYLTFVYFLNKSLKEKIVKVLDGKIENKELLNLIIRAKSSSKIKFISRTVLMYVGLSLGTVIINVIIDFIRNLNFDIFRYLEVFLFIVAFISIGGIVNANSIWNLSRSNK